MKFAGSRSKCPPSYKAGKANFQHEIRRADFMHWITGKDEYIG